MAKRLDWQPVGPVRRARLPNGCFVDHATARAHYTYGHSYGVWRPGAGERGIAACVGFGDTLAAALQMAGFAV